MSAGNVLENHPSLSDLLYLEKDDVLTGEEFVLNYKSYLLVTQSGKEDAGQHLFEIRDDGLTPIASDTIIDIGAAISGLAFAPQSWGLRQATCGVSSSADHETVHELAKELVGNFSSRKGPDGGNLACVWAVRKIMRQALGRTVHRTDSTHNFGEELDGCFENDLSETDVAPGGIVISPTVFWPSKTIGHVGILGEGSGEDRLIYSNSSRQAVWDQNFTLGSWVDRYKDTKKLAVRFYPIPNYADSVG